MKYRVALTRPRYDAYVVMPPLNIGYLAARLKSISEVEVSVFDPFHRPETDIRGLAERIVKFLPDMVGISLTTDLMDETRQLVRSLRKKGFVKPIVVGGIQASSLPEETLSYTGADIAVVGEGEQTLAELVDFYRIGAKDDLSEIPGICYSVEGLGFKRSKTRLLIEDLDSLPIPDWEAIDPNLYPRKPHGIYTRNYPAAPIISSRGCVYNCSFCASAQIWGGRLRYRSPERVIDEMRFLHDRLQIREFHFEDDNITASKRHAIRLFEAIIQSGLKVSFKCPNGIRMDSLDEDIVALMKRAGCYQVSAAIESGDQAIIDGVDKKLDLEVAREKLALLKKHGILVHGFFMIGFPDDTLGSTLKTLAYSFSPYIDTAQFLVVAPIPGSRIYAEYRAGKNTQEIDWKNINVHTSLTGTKHLSSTQVKMLQRMFLFCYYSHPVHFYKFIRFLKWNQALNIFHIFRRFVIK